MEPNWLDSYYEALEFFYFEPQHMRRNQHISPEREKALETSKKILKQSSRFPTVQKHLREMEVTLNHNIKQFFYLAPDDLRKKLFQAAFEPPDQHFDGGFKLWGREVDSELKLANVMQPDFLFVSNEACVSMEMKINAKCSVKQVMKYALLGLAVEDKDAVLRSHYLIILGKGGLPKQFKEQFETTEAVEQELHKADVEQFLSGKSSGFLSETAKYEERKDRLCEIIRDMKIAFWNYERFSKFLNDVTPPDLDESPGAQVYRKLTDGLLSEFECRGLINRATFAIGA